MTLIQTIIHYTRIEDFLQDSQDIWSTVVIPYFGFGILLPVVLTAVIWMTKNERQQTSQSIFDSGLVAIAILAIVIGGGTITNAYFPSNVGDYWLLSVAAPFIVAIAIVAIMIRRMRARKEW